MAVLNPLRVTITNYSGNGESLEAPWHPKQPELGMRTFGFGASLYIEREDFEEVPPRKYKRLSPGALVRLRYGYIVRCEEVVKDGAGNVCELRCTYEPDSKSGSDTSGLKPKGVIHWVDAATARPLTARLYGRLLREPVPDPSDLAGSIAPDSAREVTGFVEPAVVEAPFARFQFERLGYFARDPSGAFNRTVTLRDSYRPG